MAVSPSSRLEIHIQRSDARTRGAGWYSVAHVTISIFLWILFQMGPNAELQAQVLPPAQGSQPATTSTLQSLPGETAAKDSKGKRVMYRVSPSTTDPDIKDGDGDNLVLFDQHVAPNANLLVFIGGTARYRGADQREVEVSQEFAKSFPSPFLNLAVDLGYRVISLDFKYAPAGTAICPRIQDRTCYERFREKKVFGTGNMPEVPTTPAESIVNRLIKLLQYVARQYPEQGWEDYLVNGQPNWSRIALTGHSQGAGLAAFLAKRMNVARVILNSSPWDHYTRPPAVDAWLSWPSATPYERWYGLYHAKEGEAMWMERTYAALRIPHDHIRVEKLEPRHPAGIDGDHYHFGVIGINFTPLDADGNYAFRDDWAFALGQGTPSPTQK